MVLPDAAIGAEDDTPIIYNSEVAWLGTSLHQPTMASTRQCPTILSLIEPYDDTPHPSVCAAMQATPTCTFMITSVRLC